MIGKGEDRFLAEAGTIDEQSFVISIPNTYRLLKGRVSCGCVLSAIEGYAIASGHCLSANVVIKVQKKKTHDLAVELH